MSSLSPVSAYKFTETQDWFSGHIPVWRELFPLVTSKSPKILEIGCWEGRSAVFLLTSPLCSSGGSIVCIDHFDLMVTPAGRERYSKVIHNLGLTEKSFRIIDDFSVPALLVLLAEAISTEDEGYDWIYVDASHDADDTFLDGELAWRLAKKDAIFIFDDYRWNKEEEGSPHHPKRGIDAFMALHDGEFEVLSNHYQMILKKTSRMKIGFSMKGKADVGLERALGYGIHIALTIDSAYAMPAAVAIKSILEHSCARITFYILDCGISEDHKDMIRSSLPKDSNVTLVFLELPARSFAADMGTTWAKLDLIKVLPIERVIYLDADILVRGDIKPLWDVDLCGKPLAAAQDVGYPLGHEEIERGPYFNAGVLLMDLTQIRKGADELERIATKLKGSKYRDQDVLNVYFKDQWAYLRLEWNAQGLGTYANSPGGDRDVLQLEEMVDAKIVHFTGPVRPALEHVMNPYIQPCTCKPWGYLGAPGHPYREEWWQMLEKTNWAPGWRTSFKYIEWCKEEMQQVKQAAIVEFDRQVEHQNRV